MQKDRPAHQGKSLPVEVRLPRAGAQPAAGAPGGAGSRRPAVPLRSDFVPSGSPRAAAAVRLAVRGSHLAALMSLGREGGELTV